MDNMNTSCFPLALTALKKAKVANERIDNLPLPMVFKGTLGTGGTISTLPTASSENEGYVYIVITNGTYAGQSAKAGDLFVSNGTSWVLVPSADEPSVIDDSVTSTALTWSSKKISDECKVKSFTYIGDGTNPNIIEFPEIPTLILSIEGSNAVGNYTNSGLIVWGLTDRTESFLMDSNFATTMGNISCVYDNNNKKLTLLGINALRAFSYANTVYTVYYI